MNKTISLTLSIDSTNKDTANLVQDLKQDPNIDTVEQTDALAVGEAILIGVSIRLITDLLKKTPEAAVKFKNFIRGLLNKGKEASKGEQQPKIKFTYRQTVIEVSSGSDQEIDKLIKNVLKAHNIT